MPTDTPYWPLNWLHPPPPQASPNDTAVVIVTILTSYQHMGKAEFSCVAGCTCNRTVWDAHSDQPVSVTAGVRLLGVTQSPGCVVQVRVLPETSTGEHKYKVIQVMAMMPSRGGGEDAIVAGEG